MQNIYLNKNNYMEKCKEMIAIYLEEYSDFNKIISEKIKNEKDNNSFIQLKDKKYFLISFIMFSHIKNYIAGNSFEEIFNINENSNFLLNSVKNQIKAYKNDLLYYWQHFLIVSFIEQLKILLKKRKKSNFVLNKILFLFHQNVYLLSNFYKNGIIDIKHIISLLDIFFFWIREGYNLIENEKIEYDLFYKLKNYYIFQTYFNLAKNIFLIEIKSNDENNYLKYLFEHLNKLNTIKQEKAINNIILINNSSFHDFFFTIISNMNKELYKKYSNDFKNFSKDIISSNFHKSKIFEKMLENMKNSFLDLSIIKSEKNREFENNIVKQNFFCDLLKELFDDTLGKQKFSFFNYNGIDSVMSYKISKSFLSNNIIIFSFKFYENKYSDNKIFPLVSFYNESKDKNKFLLYIKYIKSVKKFFLFASTGIKMDVFLEKKIKFEKDKLYYIALYFKNENMTIFVNEQKETKTLNEMNGYDLLQIGYNKESNFFFNGVIGPFFVLETVKDENINFSIIIEQILKRKDKYPDFIYSIARETTYDFSMINTFNPTINKEQKMYSIQCKFYISPDILNYLNYKEKKEGNYFLPFIPFISDKEQPFNISQLNISLLEFDKIEEQFLMNNGLYYICLQFEYFFQIFSIFINKNINIKLDKEINNIIKNIINNSLSIVNEYSNNILNFYKEFKMIFLNLLNSMKKFVLLTGESFSDFFIKKFGSLIGGIFIIIEGKREINNSKDDKENDVKKLIALTDGLLDFLFTSEFYKNSNIQMIKYIFSLLISISKNLSDKIFLTNPNLFWKFLGFIQLLENRKSENQILDNNKIKAFDNEIRNQIFLLIKDYFICIKSQTYQQEMFCKFFYYCLNTYKNNYKMIHYFIDLIYDLISKGYYIEKYEIEFLINYVDEIVNNKDKNKDDNNMNNNKIKINLYDKDDDNIETINKIVYKISLILINLIYIINLDDKLNCDFKKLLNSIDLTIEIIRYIGNELFKIFTYFLNFNRAEENNPDINLNFKKITQSKALKILSGIYEIIIEIFKMINNNYNNRGIRKTSLNNELLSLMLMMNNKINEEFKRKKKDENIYYIFQNYIIFINKIVFNQFFDDFTVIELDIFEFILTEITDKCINEYIFNTNILITIKVDDNYYQKTFIEIFIDIYINILFNLKFLKSSKTIYENLNKIIFNPIITKNGETIFYFNDEIYLKKKQGKIEKNIISINNLYYKKNKEKFENSFTTFALYKFASYYTFLKNKIFEYNDDISKFLEMIIVKLLKEHFELYKSNINIFFKSSKNIKYKNLLEEIVKYIIENNKSKINNLKLLSDFSQYFSDNLSHYNSISEEITSGNCNIEITINESKNYFLNSNITENSMNNISIIERKKINHSKSITKSINSKEIEGMNEIIINDNDEREFNGFYIVEKAHLDNKNEGANNNNSSKSIEELIVNEYISENKEINLSKLTQDTYFLEDIDDYYIHNIKKDIMNNIFSLYFIDTFFSNFLFKKMKIFYFNKYPASHSKTKKLNFPSKIKKFSNGLEPDNILKLNYKFFIDKYFPISHPYFYDYMIQNNISPSKYIKLYHKNINSALNKIKFILDCELIKVDKYYFGEIFFLQKEKHKFIIFKEKKNKFSDYNESILDSKEKGKNIFSSSFILHKLKNRTNKRKYKNQFTRNEKIVIIKLDEIDEIVEKRSFLMWQSIEIYLKSGKSYFLNLLSEENKNILLKTLEKDKDFKNLIHKKDFFAKNKPLNKSWKNKFISTYENLLLLNKYASRSFNDISQYPVFPWLLLKNYEKIGEINEINEEQEETELYKSSLRIFKYPICLQNQKKREGLLEKYRQDDEFQHHLGIHYSTSSYIDYYLMRQQPFSNLMIKLQNYQQENPNRMFLCLAITNYTLQETKDSREIIPELFSHFEYLINLNCDYLGTKFNDEFIDDHKILIDNTFFNVEKKDNPFFEFVYFIIEHKKLLNSKIVLKSINEWIDNIFGIGQYPTSPKLRENSFNIFIQSSYEQLYDLNQKYLEHIEEVKLSNQKLDVYKTFLVEINLVVNFGVVPYQIFKDKYYKIDYKKKKTERENNEIEDEILEQDGFEENINKIQNMNKKYSIKKKEYFYNYFEINSSINKIFLISEENYMEIIDTNIYSKSLNTNEGLINELTPFIVKRLPYFSFKEKIEAKFKYPFFLYNVKYAFCSFDMEQDKIDSNPNNIFKTYGRALLEEILENKESKENKEKSESNKYIKFLTCRYLDKSFKIHQLPMEKIINIKILPKPISFVCEDFVSSCCAISFCQFLIGLKNGKLIQCSFDRNIQIKIERYIQCHHDRINSIEVNKKLGLIITSGNDNLILIRKLFDFELLSPIKIKNKYLVVIAKVSPNNFLYALCYDKQKNSCVIFGYTLNGLKFAKSEYGYYNNFDFTENGNIVTLKQMEKLCIFSGSNLDHIKIYNNNFHDFEVLNKIKNPIWLKYDYFLQKDKNEEYIHSRIITYINDKKTLITIDVSNNCFFN